MTLYEIEGFLRGKCLPGDLLVGESTAEYIFRKLKERDELKAKMDMINELMSVAEQANVLAKEGVEALGKEREALAAENSALQSAHPQPFGPEMMRALEAYEKHQDEVPEKGMLDAFFILRESIRVNTAATDAAIANIQAQGVDMFVSALQKHVDEGDFSGDEIAVITGAIDAGGEFAEQLRKEATND